MCLHQNHDFAAERLEFFEAYAVHVAVALENALLYEEQQNLASIDGLTSLHNRRSFDEMLRRELSRMSREGRSLALLMLDIDYFKKYNDTYGHPSGDKILRTLASILRSKIREGDIAARYGGEEFTVILPEVDLQYACEVAERIRINVIEQMKNGSETVTVSIGVASSHVQILSDLIQAADTALHQAKRGGRNRVVVYRTNKNTANQGPQ